MTKRFSLLLFLLLILCLSLTACERSASVSSVATSSSSEIPFPVATQPQIMRDILAATQTAAVIQGTIATGGLTTDATSTQAFVYVTATAGTGSGTTATPMTLSTLAATTAPTKTVTPTAIAYATSTPGIPSSYTIHEGEFPYCLARRFNVDPVELLSINGLSLNSYVSVNTKLSIPQSGSFPGERALKSHPTTYTVKSGDTVYSIACGFGDVDPNIIIAANGLDGDDDLTTGQQLYIP